MSFELLPSGLAFFRPRPRSRRPFTPWFIFPYCNHHCRHLVGGIIGKKGTVIQEITERSEVQSATVKDDSVVFVGMAVSGSTLEPKSVSAALHVAHFMTFQLTIHEFFCFLH